MPGSDGEKVQARGETEEGSAGGKGGIGHGQRIIELQGLNKRVYSDKNHL